MEMRLGKTLVCIRHAVRVNYRRILVIAPKTAMISWREELEREHELYHMIDGTQKQRRALVDTLQKKSRVRVWYLIGYETLRVTPEMTNLEWDWIIADESTRIKNTSALTTRIINGYRINGVESTGFHRHIPRTILSGLVAPESPIEVFEQFYFLDGEFMGFRNFWNFRSTLFTLRYGQWFPKAGVRERIKEEVHERAFVLTRHKAGMGKRVIREIREVEASPRLMKMYQAAERDFELDGFKTNWKLVVQTWLARLAGGFDLEADLISAHKIRELKDLLQNELQSEQVVVWFHFRAEMQAVADMLRKSKIRFGEIHGGVNSEERKRTVQRFRDGKIRVVLGQIDCGRFALDLSSADTAIYYSNTYSAEGRFQSEDRIVHPKKDRPLLYIDLVTKGTVDVDCVKSLGSKRINGKLFMRRFRKALERRF